MTTYVGKHLSPRHSFVFHELPTVKGSMFGMSIVRHYPEDYGAIIDSVYEMARDVADANSVSHEAAIDQVCKDENWKLLRAQRTQVLAKLKE